MIGITSYGGYLPRLRLKRQSIFQAMGWFAPAIMAVAQGTRSACNWDEDSLSMAVEATRDCLIGVDKRHIDGCFLCSTTLPYADRQNAGIVATANNLREDIITADFTGSLKTATTAMVTAFDALSGGGKQNVLVTASDKRETRGAYFYEMWFGDGAASLLLGKNEVIAEFLGSYSVSYDFVDHYRSADRKYDYMWEERWVRDAGYSKILPEAIGGLLKKLNLPIKDVAKIVYPCFFTREHMDIGKRLGATKEQLHNNMHEQCGETGAAHPLVMLISALEKAKPGDKILVASFGQGSDALCFQVTENIGKLKPRSGISGSLKKGVELESYEKFLKFRDLVQVEMGIRAESKGQTAMTVLWRNRKMILGLVGNKCRKCGTPQYPPMDICVNPDCGAIGEMEDYEFSDRTGRVIMYTGDLLAVSQDPPAVYGLVQMDGGGRMLLDFTDCSVDKVKVGQKVRMSFRRRWTDKDRGYHGYFWKAVPDVAS